MSLYHIVVPVEIPDDLDMRRVMIPGSGSGPDAEPPITVQDYVREDVAEAVEKSLEQYGIYRADRVEILPATTSNLAPQRSVYVGGGVSVPGEWTEAKLSPVGGTVDGW